jgi:carbonic anhydrase/acetyltransferase-like protein (isoleucine patch superfamily)
VELAAVVVVPAIGDISAICQAQSPVIVPPQKFPASSFSRLLIVGNDLLQPWMQRIRKLGMESLWLTSASSEKDAAWPALAELAKRGIERFLMIKLKSYAEIDLADLLRFHCERGNSVTEAQDAQGQLGVCLVNHRALQPTDKRSESYESSECGQVPYAFHGYAKRILAAKERQELIGDALTGACAMRPYGTQIREQVWIGEGAMLAGSVRLIGPAYIGAGATVRDGATIGPLASVERDCVVDCGTTVERATILPHTYVAPGLRIQHALVDGGYLEDLSCGVVADLQPAGLASRLRGCQASSEKFVRSDRDVPSNINSNMPGWQSSVETRAWRRVQL